MTRMEMMNRATREEVIEMIAFDELEPDAGKRLEHTIARAAATLMPGDAKTSDFTPYIEWEEEEPLTDEQLAEQLKGQQL